MNRRGLFGWMDWAVGTMRVPMSKNNPDAIVLRGCPEMEVTSIAYINCDGRGTGQQLGIINAVRKAT